VIRCCSVPVQLLEERVQLAGGKNDLAKYVFAEREVVTSEAEVRNRSAGDSGRFAVDAASGSCTMKS
jgi:hypothetical protein